MMNPPFTEIDVVILCGGAGTRLRSVMSDRPKALAPFGKVTFIDILLGSLKKQGFKNFILCTGFMKKQIFDHFKKIEEDTIAFSEEDEPLGTGGALKKAKSLISSGTFLVMNGDSICDIDFNEFYIFHKSKKALLSMALVSSKNRGDFGSVVLDNSCEIVEFKEKVTNIKNSFINAGVYFMEKEIFSYMPDVASFSLEQNFFPEMTRKKSYGFVIDGELMDIGTPERFEKARHILKEHA